MVYLVADVHDPASCFFDYFYSLVFAERPDHIPQICTILVVDYFPSILRSEHDVILTHPLGMRQTICLVCHTLTFLSAIGLNILIATERCFLYNFLSPTRIAGGFLFRFDHLPKGMSKRASKLEALLPWCGKQDLNLHVLNEH